MVQVANSHRYYDAPLQIVDVPHDAGGDREAACLLEQATKLVSDLLEEEDHETERNTALGKVHFVTPRLDLRFGSGFLLAGSVNKSYRPGVV